MADADAPPVATTARIRRSAARSARGAADGSRPERARDAWWRDPVRVLHEHAPSYARSACDVGYLVPPDRKKNLLVAFASGGEELVLKVYCDSRAYWLHTLTNPLLQHLAGAYTLRGRSAQRTENEARCLTAFRRADVRAPEIVQRAGPTATVLRRVEGTSAARLLRDGRLPQPATDFVHAMAEDIGRRQEMAVAQCDRHLLHPHPRLSNVIVSPDRSRTFIDLEGIVNPRLAITDLAALETESFLSYLWRSPSTSAAAVLHAAVDGLGAAAMGRWQSRRPGRFWFLSGTARHRRERLASSGLPGC